MPDYGARVADKAIRDTERKLRATYSTAQRELQKKLDTFNSKYKARDEAKRQLLAEGKITEQDYANWKAGQVFQQKQWQAKVNEVAAVMANSNAQAARIVNEGRLDVFSENYNYMAFIGEQQLGISFDIYNTQAVARLIMDEPQILPEWKIDKEKDYEWNAKKVNNIVQQGIIQGEGIPEMTKRLCEDLATQNENKMRTFARTAITGAQNAGRQKQMDDAAEMGIKVEKQWLATLDSRTRDAHRDRDGETVPYNEEFSGGLEYPGDPAGDPADVYNCRCTMITVYPEHAAYHEGGKQREEFEEYEEWSDTAYQRWVEEKQERDNAKSIEKSNPYQSFSKTSIDYESQLGKAGYSQKDINKIDKLMLQNGWKKYGLSSYQYWLKLVNGEMTDQDIEKILANNGSMEEEKAKPTKSLTKEEKQKGIELYRMFVEGQSDKIHSMAGYKPFGGGYSPDRVDEESMRLIDSVFTPAERERHVYKGQPMTEADIQTLMNGGFLNHTLSSTSTKEETARSYMENAYEMDMLPVLMDIRIEPGIPIADAREILGDSGMKAFEAEITIGRNVVWECEGVTEKTNAYGDEYYEATIVLRKEEDEKKKR